MKEHYQSNKAFKEYVDKYAKQRNISVDDALKHKLIRYVWLFAYKNTK